MRESYDNKRKHHVYKKEKGSVFFHISRLRKLNVKIKEHLTTQETVWNEKNC